MTVDKVVRTGVIGVVGSLFLINVVSAHVTLDPKEGVIGYQRYTVNVPNEKDIPTTELRLVVPEGVEISGVAPVSGWTHTEKRAEADPNQKDEEGHAAQGLVTEITWSGGKINPGEYQGFGISTRYQDDPAEISWRAYQKYADGTVVAWDDTNEDAPAPKVSLINESKVSTLSNQVTDLQRKTNVQAPLWFSFIAVLFSVAAFMVALRKR